MKKTKLFAAILATCFMFSCTACDISNLLLALPSSDSSSSAGSDSSSSAGSDSSSSSTSSDSSSSSSSDSSSSASSDSSSSSATIDSSSSDTEDTDDTDDTVGISPINVIMVNDNHGVLNEEDGSMDKIASGISYFDSLGNTIKIANGDMFQGTYVSSSLKGLPMLEALNLLEFDAFVVGNHEFDWGFDEMKKYKDGDETNGEANFPFLGANIYDKRTREMVDWLEPYTVVDFDEVKVGIIGIIGQVESSIMASHVADYEFVDARNIVKDLAIELRTVEDCDVVIVASHGDDDRLNYDLVEYDGTSKIDAIFTGHSHTPTDEEISRGDGSKVRVLQNGGYGESFALLTLKFDEQGNLKDTDGGLYPTYQFESEGILSPVFEKYAEKIAVGNEVLLTIDQSVSRQEIGIEIAHSMFLKYGVDCAIINTGGVRTSVEAGDVTYADLFQVLPFENEVYIVRMSALEMVEFISNTSVYYWMLNNIDIDGEYQMAIVDYVYLSDSFAPYRKDDYIDTNDLIRDVFIDYILLYA